MQSAGKRVEVLVIGAGFGGIGVGINLLKDGVTDFVIIEAEDDVGGTWRTNRNAFAFKIHEVFDTGVGTGNNGERFGMN